MCAIPLDNSSYIRNRLLLTWFLFLSFLRLMNTKRSYALNLTTHSINTVTKDHDRSYIYFFFLKWYWNERETVTEWETHSKSHRYRVLVERILNWYALFIDDIVFDLRQHTICSLMPTGNAKLCEGDSLLRSNH